MRRFLTLLVTLLVFGAGSALGQVKQVSGVVTSADDKQPIPGASVFVKEAPTVGTSTDINGKYTLKGIPANAKTIVFRFVGYTTLELPIKAELSPSLQSETQKIDEVVVTAMGISKEKKALAYAVQDVKADELTKGANTNLASALQGKVSGVEISPSSGMPGASAKMTIRGSRSFTGDNTPLYIVDGMPIASTSDVSTMNSVTGTDFANRSVDLDPNDIESINVLKGQAASALYGMRATNGVVLITTKSGKGIAKGKPIITLNANVSFDVISVIPDLQTEFAQGSAGVYKPTASTSWGPAISKLADDSKYGGNTVNDYTTALGKHNGMYYVPQRANAGLDPWATPRSYDNVGKFFNTGFTSSNSANISQNMDKGNYSFTLGNTKSDGIVPSTGLNRYNAKMAAEVQLNSNWTTGFTGNYVASKITKQSSANNGVVATVYPAPPSYDLEGIPSHYDGDPYKQNTYRSTSGFDGAYWAVDNNAFTERSQRFFGNAFLKYSTKLNTDNQKLDIKYQLGDDSYTTDYSDVWGYGHSNSKGEIYQYGYTVNEMNSLLTAAYSWKINDKLSFDALLGNEFVDTKRKHYYEYGKDFNFSGWNHMNNASVYNASESYTKNRTVGTFLNLALSYDNMLFLNATGRNDVVSSMPRNNRSFFYPSVSLGWIFTELDAVKNNILTYGKVRLSYAEVGQAGQYVDSYYSTPVYGGGFSSGTPMQYPIGSVVAFTPNTTVYDPNLKPQNTKSYEFGTDLAFLNGLVSINYTFSRQNVKDQIFDVPLAASTGSSQLKTNGGSLHTNAHELSVSVAPIKKNNFKWDFAFNFTKIDNYVDELAPGVPSIFLGGFTEPQVRAGIGYKFPVIYGVSYKRNDAGKIIVDADGFPMAGEEKVIGTVSPDFQLGFNNTFEIYKFRISALIDWKSGGQMYGGTAGMLDYYGVSQKSADYRKKDFFYFEKDAVKITGTDANGKPTYAPNDIKISGADAQAYFSNQSDISESMIYDNSFVKLREISISYPVWNKKGITVNVSGFARNIILWSELKGLDPEAAQGNTNMAGAFERFSLPGTSSYGFGINVKF
jgi:TonB-linked SusC/RagA family outer membrane protein